MNRKHRRLSPRVWRLVCVLAVSMRWALPVAAAEPATKAAAPRPNVIFILADDLGWGDLGCYGHGQIRTPHLDRLAGQGILFTQFYVCGSVCSPSRAAFMTGQFPARQRIHSALVGGSELSGRAERRSNAQQGMVDYLDPAVPTVTRLLQQAGYATGHFGKWHLGNTEDAPLPAAYGIDEHRCFNGNGPGWNLGDPYFRAKSTDHIVDETLRFIEAHRDRPFYVQAWLPLPHAILHPTDEQLESYARFSPPNVPYKGALQVYYASVTAIDTGIGRLLDRLEQLGLSQNTLILFSSDNGPEDIHIPTASHSGVGSTGPFRGQKRSLYEGGIRVPFIARWPAETPAGQVDRTSVIAGADLLPTMCALASVPLPAGVKLDGEDMSGPLRGQPTGRTRPLMWEWRFGIAGDVINKSPMLAIREGPWKLLMNPDRSRVELYDIPNDPSEFGNLADRQPEVVKRLSERLLAWQSELPPGPVARDAGSNAYPWP